MRFAIAYDHLFTHLPYQAINPLYNQQSALAGNPMMPFVQGMMQSLLSAEVLLPSLRELLVKYPEWLAENEGKVDAVDLDRFTKQQELFKVICAELELEKADDSSDVKNERFKKVLALMQKVNIKCIDKQFVNGILILNR